VLLTTVAVGHALNEDVELLAGVLTISRVFQHKVEDDAPLVVSGDSHHFACDRNISGCGDGAIRSCITAIDIL
jgi:hypothetical protein